MGGNQNTIAYDKHNLWLLDDRLTFHRYIYSDKQIKSHKPIEDTSACKKKQILQYMTNRSIMVKRMIIQRLTLL